METQIYPTNACKLQLKADGLALVPSDCPSCHSNGERCIKGYKLTDVQEVTPMNKAYTRRRISDLIIKAETALDVAVREYATHPGLPEPGRLAQAWADYNSALEMNKRFNPVGCQNNATQD